MKKRLTEQINHIYRLMNVKNNIQEVEKVVNKADYVTDDVKEFFQTLENAINTGGISEQRKGTMMYQKSVETMQIGLLLLGYDLPRFGIDGLFGPETAQAVNKFVSENMGKDENISEAVKLVAQGGSIIGKPGQGTHNANDWQSRNAWDVTGPVGSDVYSVTSGVVKRLRKGSGSGVVKSGVKKIYGDQISIQSTDGKPDVFYTHIETDLNIGDNVREGDVIGKIVQAGGITPHVHIGISSGNLSDLATGTSNASGRQNVTMTKATPEMLRTLVDMLKQRGVSSDDFKNLINKKSGGMSSIQLSGNWLEMSVALIKKHEGFISKAKWDENAYRGGYGSDKKLVNGRLEKVTKETTWTQKEADDTLEYEIRNFYAPTVARQLGMENWNKLNDKQKASLVSLGYGGPYFLTAREYGRKIKQAIENNDMELAAQHIRNGPTRGLVSGKFYSGLYKRRKEEADIFMS